MHGTSGPFVKQSDGLCSAVYFYPTTVSCNTGEKADVSSLHGALINMPECKECDGRLPAPPEGREHHYGRYEGDERGGVAHGVDPSEGGEVARLGRDE